MPTTNMTEAQIKKAARKIARKATALRNAGRYEEAKRIVDEALRNVEALRAARPRVCPVCQDGACETKSTECGQ